MTNKASPDPQKMWTQLALTTFGLILCSCAGGSIARVLDSSILFVIVVLMIFGLTPRWFYLYWCLCFSKCPHCNRCLMMSLNACKFCGGCFSRTKTTSDD